jgi:hypothetical protein
VKQLLSAPKKGTKHWKLPKVQYIGDCLAVVKILQGKTKCEPFWEPYMHWIRGLGRQWGIQPGTAKKTGEYMVHVPRSRNKRADALSNLAMDGSTDQTINGNMLLSNQKNMETYEDSGEIHIFLDGGKRDRKHDGPAGYGVSAFYNPQGNINRTPIMECWGLIQVDNSFESESIAACMAIKTHKQILDKLYRGV